MDYIITRIAPLFILATLLFWQKRKINILIMFHIAIVSTLYARGYTLQPNDWGELAEYSNEWVFSAIFISTQNFVFCFGFFWLYQWWYIGRRRSEISGEW